MSVFAARPNPPQFVAQEWDVFQPAGGFAADSVSSSDFGMLVSRSAALLGLSEREYGQSGPMREIRKASESAGSMEQILEFAQPGARLDMLRNLDASLRLTASGLRRWGVFRDAARRRHCPPTEESVLAWSSFHD